MRVRRTAGGVTTRYLYDGDDLAAEVDASGNRIRSDTYYPGVDSPQSMRTWENAANGAVHYYALDLPGNNVSGMFDATGAVTHRYSYAPFGEPISATGTVTNPAALRRARDRSDHGAVLRPRPLVRRHPRPLPEPGPDWPGRPY